MANDAVICTRKIVALVMDNIEDPDYSLSDGDTASGYSNRDSVRRDGSDGDSNVSVVVVDVVLWMKVELQLAVVVVMTSEMTVA